MKSLRTDDIMGARPRIRHAPRNLINEQYKQQHQNYSYRRQPNFIETVNMSESMHEKSPPINGRRQPAPYQSHAYNYNRQNSGHQNIQNRQIMPKQAPKVSYAQQQYYSKNLQKQPSLNQYTYASQQKDKLNQYHDKMLAQLQNAEQRANFQQLNKIHNNDQRQQSRGSQHNLQRNRKQSASMDRNQPPRHNIFRGLGYNIITNHKFSYDMENTRKNQTSKWIDY